jgi:hypothetical protein
MSEKIVYIGVDDTDTLDSIGTGRVARGLAGYLENLGLGKSLGVSRHQLLVHDQIKYTSHNSSKGLAIKSSADISDFYEPAIEYMKQIFVQGSDPGLCICPEEKFNREILDYALSTQKIVLHKEEASRLASKYSIFLHEIGGDGGGIIGALAAVGLRAGGNDGRLVDLRGIREITGMISVGNIKKQTDIISVQDTEGRVIPDDDIIDSLDWIKPSLINGQPVLRVKLVVDNTGKQVWQPAEKKFTTKDKKGAKHG